MVRIIYLYPRAIRNIVSRHLLLRICFKPVLPYDSIKESYIIHNEIVGYENQLSNDHSQKKEFSP